MIRFRLAGSALLLLAVAGANRPAAAAWSHEPNNGNLAVCTAVAAQYDPKIVADGAGGAIIVWADFRNGLDYNIYAQRISAAGVPQWAADGVAVCTATRDQATPTIAPDGAGGAIVSWADVRSGVDNDVYAQRINAAGVPQWTAQGVALSTAAGDQFYPRVIPDGVGGSIVTWFEYGGVTSYDIRAQRVSAAGAPQWAAQGVAICTAAGQQNHPAIVSDGAGGAIVTWYDLRSGTDFDIYAQRLSAGGLPQWLANGVAMCTATGEQFYPEIASDGAGGAIVAWEDGRIAPEGFDDIYAQRISAGGVLAWPSNGVALCAAANHQRLPIIVSDGAGGAIVTWEDGRSGPFDIFTDFDIYAQRVNALGTPQWVAQGAAVCTAANSQSGPAIILDGADSAIVAWYDKRSGTTSDIYAQRIGLAGSTQWTANGVALSKAAGDQFKPKITSDGAGGAIVTWYDFRGVTNSDIYAQRIAPFGKLGGPEPVIAPVLDIPNDQGGRVRLAWDASYLDRESDPDLAAYDIFHSVPPNVALDAMKRGVGRRMRPGEVPTQGGRGYLFTDFSTQQLAWEFVSTVPPQHFIATYGSTQATTGDSIAGSNPTTSFMIVGRNGTGTKYWLSTPAAGYSVDNLPPSTPAPFTGQYVAGTAHLHWNRNSEPDLAGYRLYRGTSAAFTPSPANLVSALPDTGYADGAGVAYVYKLTAVDSHGNESPATTLTLGSALGVNDTPNSALSFAAPSPNPARGSATLDYTLAHAGHVRLTVYNAAGRRVQVLRDGEQGAGAHRESFAFRDKTGRTLANGLYLFRLEAEGRVLTRRIAAIR